MFLFLMFLATVFSAPVDMVVHKDNNPVFKGLIAQPNFVKNLIQNKTLLSELTKADPDTLRSILGLLEGLVSVSEAASLKFTTDVDDAAQVKETKSGILVVAVQAEVDAIAAVTAAQSALAAAEIAKTTATGEKNIAEGEYYKADAHHIAMEKELTDKQPGVDAETVTMNEAIDLIKSLIPADPTVTSSKGGNYVVGTMALGGLVWTDREYKFGALPDTCNGGVLFSGPVRIPDGSILHLTGGQKGTMYAFLTQGRGGSYPSTLLQNGWTKTQYVANWLYGTQGQIMDVFTKSSGSETLPAASGGDTVVVFGFVAV